MKHVIEKLKNHKYFIIIFLLISLTAFYWLKNGLPIAFGDSGLTMFYNFSKEFSSNLYVWNNLISTGTSNGVSITLLPLDFFYKILENLGIQSAFKEAIGLSLLFFVSFIFCYLLILEIFEQSDNKKIIAFFSAIFYVIGPLTILTYLYRFQYSLYILPAAPAIFFFVIRGLKTRNLFFNSFYVAMTFFIFSFAFFNIAYMLPVLFIIISYVIYYLIKNISNKSTRDYILKFSILSIVLTLILNLWWILPFISSLQYSFSTATQSINPLQTLQITSANYIRLFSIFQFTPYVNDGMWLWKINSFKDIYYSLFFSLISIFFISIIVSSLLQKINKHKGEILFFSIFLLIGIFLGKGLLDPFGNIFQFLFMNIPFFQAFRDPLDKFTILIILAATPLFGLGMERIYTKISKKSNSHSIGLISLALISLFLFGFYIFPFWSGQIISSNVNLGNGANTSVFTKIPQYYANADSWLEEQNYNFKLISLPLNSYGALTYKWKSGYEGGDFSWLLFSKPVISSMDFGLNTPALYIQDSIEKNSSLSKIASLLDVKYIIISKDIDTTNGNYQNGGLTPQNLIIQFLANQTGISFYNSFGLLDFYNVSDKYFLPHIYTANSYIITNNITSMLNLVNQNYFNPGNSVIFFNNSLNNENISKFKEMSLDESNYHPQISFKEINPTKYEVNIENATKPFFLVFSESYDPQWKAYIGNQFNCDKIAYYNNTNVKECPEEERFTPFDISYLLTKPLSEDNHLLANGYANSWYINPKNFGSENFTITLYYLPQSYFYLGLIISGTTLIICIGYLVYNYRKNKKYIFIK
jgi:hypothetical protein